MINLLCFIANALFVVVDVKVGLGVGYVIANSFAAGVSLMGTLDDMRKA